MRKRIHNGDVKPAFEDHRFGRYVEGDDNGMVGSLNARFSQNEPEATGPDPKNEVAVLLQLEMDRNPNLIQNFGW